MCEHENKWSHLETRMNTSDQSEPMWESAYLSGWSCSTRLARAICSSSALPLRLSLFSFAFPGSPATGQRHKAREQASQAEQADTLAANCHSARLAHFHPSHFFIKFASLFCVVWWLNILVWQRRFSNFDLLIYYIFELETCRSIWGGFINLASWNICWARHESHLTSWRPFSAKATGFIVHLKVSHWHDPEISKREWLKVQCRLIRNLALREIAKVQRILI